MKLLSEKVVIITGSSSGIGKEIAMALAMRDASVVVTSRRFARAVEVAEEITSQGGNAFPLAFSVEDPQCGIAMLQAVHERFNKIDILVNNAINRPAFAPCSIQETKYEQLSEVITTNLTTTLALSARAHQYLLATKGLLLNIGSVVVNRHMVGMPLYTIVKGAITQTTKVLAAEWAEDGVRVNQINPGFVETDSMAERIGEDAASNMCKKFLPYHPLGRTGTVTDIAELVSYMVSEEAAWMTGSVVDMDGGYSIQAASFSKKANASG